MSCGNHHDVDCSQVLERLNEVLDNEADEATCAMVLQHLAECPPCNTDAGTEKSIKALVARACGCEPVPEDLRRRVSLTIASVQVESDAGIISVRSIESVQSIEWTDSETS